MKKKFLKLIATIMCVVITCLSVSVGSFATNDQPYEAKGIDRYVERILTNESETISLLEISNDYWYSGGYVYEEHGLAITEDGENFTILNFDKYIPEKSNCIMLYDCAVKGDLFAIVLKSYNKTFVEGETRPKYEEDATIILTTTDFETYTDCRFEVIQDKNATRKEDLYHPGHLHPKGGLLGFVGNTLIFADMSYEASEDKFTGLYYSLDDMKKWELNRTPVFEKNETPEGYSYNSIVYSVVEDTLLVEKVDLMDYGCVCLEAYATKDCKNYARVYEKEENVEYASISSIKVKNSDDLIFLAEEYDFYDDGKDFAGLYTVNIRTGKKSLLCEINTERMNNGVLLSADESNVYLVTSDNQGNTEKITIHPNFNIEKSVPTYKINEIQMVEIVGAQAVAFNSKELYYFYDHSFTEYEKYDISEIGFDGDGYWTKTFKLKGKLCLMESKYDENFPDGPIYYPAKIAIIAEEKVKNGDLNGDDKINSSDALLVLQHSVGKITLDDTQKSCADVNKDGKINSSDALMILQYSVGKIDSL